MIPVTKHGDLRVRKRLGLPRKTVEKQAAKAFTDGQPVSAFSGAFKRYLDLQGINFKSVARVYKGNIYFYNKEDNALITCWQVPSKYRKYLKGKAPDG